MVGVFSYLSLSDLIWSLVEMVNCSLSLMTRIPLLGYLPVCPFSYWWTTGLFCLYVSWVNIIFRVEIVVSEIDIPIIRSCLISSITQNAWTRINDLFLGLSGCISSTEVMKSWITHPKILFRDLINQLGVMLQSICISAKLEISTYLPFLNLQWALQNCREVLNCIIMQETYLGWSINSDNSRVF